MENNYTLTDLDSIHPGSLLKTTPPPPGYPWFRGARAKNHPKTVVFDQIWLFLSGFLVLVLLKVDGRAPNP